MNMLESHSKTAQWIIMYAENVAVGALNDSLQGLKSARSHFTRNIPASKHSNTHYDPFQQSRHST
jgi:hypothetical protein